MSSLSAAHAVRKSGDTSAFLEQIRDDSLTATVEYYAACLADSPKAVAFLAEELDLSLEQAVDHGVGFSDRSLGKLLPSSDTQHGRQVRVWLKESGICKSTGHEALRGCVTFPLYDDAGNITGIRGLRIDRKTKKDREVTIGTGTARVPIGDNVSNPSPEQDTVSEQPDDPKSVANDLVVQENQVTFAVDDRRYRIRGLEKNTSAYTLKVNLMVVRDDLVHLDTLDLSKARSRASFVKAASAELFIDADLIKRDIGQLTLKLEALREQQIADAKAPAVKAVELSANERDSALSLLRSPDLLGRIVSDMDACGMVGESTNKLAGYLAATSRKLADPLAIVIQSSSSAGKTSLMDAILSMMPDEDVNRFSGMTGQSLFYLESDAIRHKVLAISEDEGIIQATYALKLLQSEGELRHATTGRDESGNMRTKQHLVEGPVQIMLTTTAMDIDEELVNRCMVLTVDESRDQTGAIQAIQRGGQTLAALNTREDAKRLRQLHQNAQRLIKPIRVMNPYAPQLTFPTNKTRLRRDHKKYLTLIETVALMHQHQRTVHHAELNGEPIEYINVEPSDIATANGIAGEVLGRSLDELAPQTRHLLMLLHEFVNRQSQANGVSRHAFRFTRRDVREATQWSDTQLHRHLTRLVDLEYLIVHRGKQGQRFVYELIYSGEGFEGQPFLMGLLDPSKLKAPSTIPSLAG